MGFTLLFTLSLISLSMYYLYLVFCWLILACIEGWFVVKGRKLHAFEVNDQEIRYFQNQKLKVTIPIKQLKRISITRDEVPNGDAPDSTVYKIIFEPTNSPPVKAKTEKTNSTARFPEFEIFATFLREYSRHHKIDLHEEFTSYTDVGTILLFGLNNTLVELLHAGGFLLGTRPTLRNYSFRIQVNKYELRVINTSGGKGKEWRNKWRSGAADGIAVIVDLTDMPARVQEIRAEFENLMTRFLPSHPKPLSTRTPVLIYGINLDVVNTPPPDFLSELLAPEKYGINYHIQPTSAKIGQDIADGFKWLVREVLINTKAIYVSDLL